MTKYYPVDIWSVKKFGIKKWYDKCPTWPISDKESLYLYEEVDQLFYEIILSSAEDISDILTILYKLTIEFTEYLNALIIYKRLYCRGYNIEYDSHKSNYCYYDSLNNINKDISGLFNKENTKVWPTIPRLRFRFKQHLRTHLRNRIYYKSLKDNIDSSLVFGIEPDEALFYNKRFSQNIRYICPYPLLSRNKNIQNKRLKAFETTARDLLNGINLIAFKYDNCLIDRHYQYYYEQLVHLFIEVEKLISIFRKMFRNKNSKHLLISSLGSTNIRTLCITASREGVNVICPNHGNSVGIFKNNTFANTEMSIVDTYLTATRGAVKLFKTAQYHYPVSRKKNAKIISIDTDKYIKMRNKLKLKKMPAKVKSVMVIEYPITEFRHKNIYAFWAYQLRLIIKISILLRRFKIKSIIKRHPDRLLESEGIYDEFFDEIITEPFEGVYDAADALFFPNLTSTTFGFSLLSNWPIFICETMLDDIWEEVRPLIKKRCRVIPSSINDNGKLIIDEGAFFDLLVKKPTEPDQEFIQKYMSPR